MSRFEKDTGRQWRPDRRQFLRSTALLAAGGASAVLLSPIVAAQNPGSQIWNPPSNGSRDPYPIPWLDRNGSHNQSPGPGMEPSSIYHFKGQIARSNDFKGMGTDNKGNRIAFGAPSTDFSFIRGEYFAARAPQQGLFTHIWLTLFEGPAVPGGNKVHDFHPPIAPSGLYWVIPVPANGLTLTPDGRQATLGMTGIAVIDQPKWPAPDAPFTMATISFRVIWKATDEKVLIDDKQKHFRFEGCRAVTQAEASVEVPSLNFSWRSDPFATSSAGFGVIGSELNGRYYDALP